MEKRNKKRSAIFLAALLPVCAALVVGACENPANGDDTPKEAVISEFFLASGSSFIIKSDGTLWAVGSNGYGQLGLGDSDPRDKFTQVKDADGKPLAGVKQVFGGGSFTIILKDDGAIWGAGSNGVGSLGLGDRYKERGDVSRYFIPITEDGSENGTPITGVTALAKGSGDVVLFLKNDGQVWAAGRNASGETGNGETARIYIFTRIETDSEGEPIAGVDAVYVFGGNPGTAFFIKDGEVWATGFNENANLGLGDTTNRSKFTKVPDLSNVAAMEGSKGSAMIPFTVALKKDGTVWGTGVNFTGALGLGVEHTNAATALLSFTQLPSDDDKESSNYISGIKAIAAGGQHVLLLKEDGTVLASGLAPSCGVMLTEIAPSPINAFAYIKFTPITDIWGDTLAGVKDIKVIGNTSHFIMKNGTVLAVGSKGSNLGLGKPLGALPNVVYLALDDNTNHIMFDSATP
jgi:alpha-tubulin suppressor-like RCC1 family protein